MKLKNIILLLIISLLLMGCGTKYEDTNGDDNYELQTLNDDSFFGSYSFQATGSYQKEFLGVHKMGAKCLDGVSELTNLYDLIYDHTVITISFHIEKGNGKLIICNDNEIIAIVEPNKDNQVFDVETRSQNAYLRIAGESLEYSIEYTLDGYKE